MEYIEVTNFEKYQHYSDRDIKWVKLYVTTPSDYKIYQISDSTRWLFMGMVLLASRHGNSTPYDIPWIKDQICNKHTTEKAIKVGLKQLASLALIKITRIKVPNSASLEENRIDKNRREEKTLVSFSPFTDSYKKKYSNLDLKEEYEKFKDYNRDVRKIPIKSESMAWRNWLKKAEEFRLTSSEVIREREREAERIKTKQMAESTGKPMPKELKEKRDALIKEIGI